jgi:CYTH domain-containing protein
VFEHPADGLVLAEVELQRVDQPVSIPAWAGVEVTDDLRYASSAIARDGRPKPRRVVRAHRDSVSASA